MMKKKKRTGKRFESSSRKKRSKPILAAIGALLVLVAGLVGIDGIGGGSGSGGIDGIGGIGGGSGSGVLSYIKNGDLSGFLSGIWSEDNKDKEHKAYAEALLKEVPEYDGSPYVIVNDNKPNFTEREIEAAKTSEGMEFYSELDSLGRCGYAAALISEEMMPTEERGSIGMIKPSGWHTYRYDDLIYDKYLYNRCHLIGFQLTGENANEKNLITGTRSMNVDGMGPFENAIAKYIREENGRVLYRVTPIFEGSNLVARGVEMEAFSVDDDGRSICFNVYVYNNQPGIIIDYATGESRRE